jgi:hypothetical protein
MMSLHEGKAVSENKVWLITGAGRGLGVDIAKAALAAGHFVVASGRDPAKALPPSGPIRICWSSSLT